MLQIKTRRLHFDFLYKKIKGHATVTVSDSGIIGLIVMTRKDMLGHTTLSSTSNEHINNAIISIIEIHLKLNSNANTGSEKTINK